ncbi:uncharacterized protein PHALS_08977 [Plasmopara halstedii]|uniref:Uncharacterized protein n=1 Tax=Plasmopara halstedii TaxID=4781 RepID=A0A0P1AE66_PLAHL|nr:uncharacterized protein PHALS_08977 [Plasmopara halstedii]CEG38932.1 hypothetical protein PHALS_08977 [Plasmopara halstedii]|eukprot:XP_024575301.1 hypothetical protein PHALS_08977 [Plasmopara halstedii]
MTHKSWVLRANWKRKPIGTVVQTWSDRHETQHNTYEVTRPLLYPLHGGLSFLIGPAPKSIIL